MPRHTVYLSESDSKLLQELKTKHGSVSNVIRIFLHALREELLKEYYLKKLEPIRSFVEPRKRWWKDRKKRNNHEFSDDILDFCESDYDLFLEMVRVRERFLTKTPKKYYQTPDEEEMAERRFNDYFIYSYTSKSYQRKPIEVFLSKMLHNYDQKDQEILQGFKNNIFSALLLLQYGRDLTS